MLTDPNNQGGFVDSYDGQQHFINDFGSSVDGNQMNQ